MKRLISLSLLMMVTMCLSARVFVSGDIIYVKMKPSHWNWYGTDPDAGKFAYFFKQGTSSNAWSTEATGVPYCDDVLQIEVPAGDWTHVILTRNSVHSGPTWDNVYEKDDDNTIHKTADIQIPANQNYLENFRQYKDKDTHGGDMWLWSDCYFFRPSADPSSSVTTIGQATREVVEVCTQSAGDPFSLQPKLISATAGYDYNQGRTWFKWVSGQWKELHHANSEWGFNGTDGLHETIGAANSHTYYFLSTKDKSKQRFIEIAVTQDCSPTSAITDFGVVTSSVNAHDSTYVLDGIVAFESANGHTLRISVTDAKGEHHVDYTNPSTPLIFSLPGLYADGATGLVATATFGTSYSRTSDSYTAPNAIIGIDTRNLDQTYGNTTTLQPKPDGSGGFKWHDGNTTDHERTIAAYGFDTTIIYTYYEYEPAPAVAGSLIDNGDFTAPEAYYGSIKRTNTITGSNISDYNFWGKDVTSASNFYDLYKDGISSLSGGFSIVTDANGFWKRYTKKIAPKVSTHYALFDADNSGEKAAWKVETSATTNKNLKLAKGTNYMFSFWVANINNYGEMNNAAKLQFEISYSLDGGSTWSTPEKLGNPIDLNDYPDNLWHQNSHVYASEVNADKVRISVKDLNTNSNPGGNDFALDDIQFQPISVISQAIKNCERFVLTIYEPAITVNQPTVTITQTPACGKTDFSMQVNVSYSTLNNMFPVTLQLTDNVYGDLFVTPMTIDPLTNPNDITIDLSTTAYAMLVADGQEHTLTATLTRLNAAGVDKGGSNSNTYTAPGVPAINQLVVTNQNVSCDKTTYDLQVATEYRAFKGSLLHYEWDGVEWTDTVNQSLSYKEATWQTATGRLRNLVADGQAHTLRVYSDSPLDCDTLVDTIAVYMPQVAVPTATVQPFNCTDATYEVKVEVGFANGQGHRLIIEDWNGNTFALSTAAADTQKDTTFAYAWEAPTSHAYKVYMEGAENCADAHTAAFTAPFSPEIASVDTIDVPKQILCGELSYTVKAIVKTPFDATGKNIILSYEGKDTTVAATGTETTVPLTLTTIGGANLTIDAAYEGAACPASASITFATPARISCNKLDTTICDGQTVTWMGHTYSGHVGLTDTITNPENVYDTLLLTVVAIPHLTIAPIAMTCNEEVAIRFPYSDPIGDPDSCTIVIGGQNYPLTMDGATDELVLNIDPMLEPGDYVGSLTVGRAGVSCTSDTTVSIRIAIANQMFVKWNDVIFISNKGNLYTAYQWYKDGVELTGETKQRYYDPTGLKGTLAEYYCRMTTTDGRTLYTCPQTFDNIPRSAEQGGQGGEQQQIVSTYRVSPHVYIIRIQTGDQVETKKIMRYE